MNKILIEMNGAMINIEEASEMVLVCSEVTQNAYSFDIALSGTALKLHNVLKCCPLSAIKKLRAFRVTCALL